MDYEQIIAGFRSLSARDFDLQDINARGYERLAELTEALKKADAAEKAVPELFGLMERLPDVNLGSPGPLVHTLERLPGYENELILSVRRRPSLLSIWMVNRALNTDLPKDTRRSCLELLHKVANDTNVPLAVRRDARRFVEFQMKKSLTDD